MTDNPVVLLEFMRPQRPHVDRFTDEKKRRPEDGREHEGAGREEVRRAVLELEGARENVAEAEDQARLAGENLELVQVSYSAGRATYLEMSDASTALASAGHEFDDGAAPPFACVHGAVLRGQRSHVRAGPPAHVRD